LIFTALDGSLAFYRALTPRWAYAPLSGEGAALQGGRLNRKGVHALYLSTTIETAIAESQQGDPLMPPVTMAQYHVTLARVVDFRAGFDPATWNPLWQDLHCNWRGIALDDRSEPPSWILGDWALEAGASGVLYASVRSPGGTNLVVYTDALKVAALAGDGGDRIAVHDPDGRLPHNQDSWPNAR